MLALGGIKPAARNPGRDQDFVKIPAKAISVLVRVELIRRGHRYAEWA